MLVPVARLWNFLSDWMTIPLIQFLLVIVGERMIGYCLTFIILLNSIDLVVLIWFLLARGD